MAFVGKTRLASQISGVTGVENIYKEPGSYLGGYTTAGNVWFVGSASGNATDTAGYGRTPQAPFNTINFAVGQAAASNGDRIYVLPGHVETITGAAGTNVNVAGLSIIGLGIGRQRPQINYTTAAAASFDINSANTLIANLVFTPTGVASITAAINVKAADVSIIGCEMEHANATNQAVLGILTTTAANRMIVQNCWFHGSNNTGTTNAIQINGGTDIQILNNNIVGSYDVALGAIQIVTTLSKNLYIGQNRIQNYTASNTKAIVDTITGTTGQIWENRMQILMGTAPITAASASWVGGNYYANAVATAGTLI